MSMPSRHVKQILATVKKRGWVAQITNGGHVKWRHDSGAFLFGSATPGDRRAARNLMAQMRRVEAGCAAQ